MTRIAVTWRRCNAQKVHYLCRRYQIGGDLLAAKLKIHASLDEFLIFAPRPASARVDASPRKSAEPDQVQALAINPRQTRSLAGGLR